MIVDAEFDVSGVEGEFDDDLFGSVSGGGVLDGVVTTFDEGEFTGPDFFFGEAAAIEIRTDLSGAAPDRSKGAIQLNLQVQSWSGRSTALGSIRHGTRELYAGNGDAARGMISDSLCLVGVGIQSYRGTRTRCQRKREEEVVEAAGVEPASLANKPAATTCLVGKELSAMR